MSDRHVIHQLPLWVEGDLAAQEASQVEAHLAACGSCRAEAEALRESQAWLKSAPTPINAEDRDALRREVLERIRSAPPTRKGELVWWSAAAMVAAASLLIALSHHGRPEAASVAVPPVATIEPPETVPITPTPRAIRVARRCRPVPRAPDPEAGSGVSRIELQTSNPQIRIIWLAQATAPPDGPLHPTQEDL